MEKLVVVIVTYKRQKLLAQLFDSLAKLESAPWRVVVVDNEDSNDTRILCEQYNDQWKGAWQRDDNDNPLVYFPQKENLGGSGGFSAGMAKALEIGASWVWMMDDDVEVIPNAIESFRKLAGQCDAVMGNRIDFDGSVVAAPYWLSEKTGIANPFKRNPFRRAKIVEGIPIKETNMLCFEGSLISGDIARLIGPPDARYFIYWDDITYGYLVSKVGNAIRADFPVVRRTRDTESAHMGNIAMDQINDTKRYYMMRNRGMLARYFKLHGDYHCVLFGIGNATVFCEEIFRMLVQKTLSPQSIKALHNGWKDLRLIVRAKDWRPYADIWRASLYQE